MNSQVYFAKPTQYKIAIISRNFWLALGLGLNLSGVPPLPTVPLNGI
jgi:hypothetical protein